MLFFTILFSMVAANLFWWRHADRLARRLAHPVLWRRAIATWCGTMSTVIVLVILSRAISPKIVDWVPQPIVAAVYIWHVLFAIEWLAWRIVFVPIRGLVRRVRVRLQRIKNAATEAADALPQAAGQSDAKAGQIAIANASDVRDATHPRLPSRLSETDGAATVAEPLSSRRQFLTAAAIAAPPVYTALAAWRAVEKFDDFRVNPISLAIPNLPAALEGLRIAHVSDIHIGKFTDDPLLKAVVERTNALRPDLILFTGDLIDWNIADLPAGLSILQRWDPKFGLCACEGNHDLIGGRFAFEQQLTRAGFAMPINSSRTFTVRGQPIQLLGLRWGGVDLADDDIGAGERDIAASTAETVAQLQEGAFPILLAHHPHAFDYLGSANIPLVLSGHTHGGQINLGPVRPASLRFRYLSGLYRKPDGKQLFVSNGVGNWFPLRVNAPAEIGDITLRRA